MSKSKKTIEKEKHILDSLENCLQQNIYSHISFEDVAAAAEMSKGGLRHYFPTKENLYESLIRRFFRNISLNHNNLLNDIDSESQDKVLVSTLYDYENFFMNEFNLKIFLNIILYAFEDPKIMELVQKFISQNFEIYYKIAQNKSSNSNDDAAVTARIIQIILLSGGLVQAIDPKNIETSILIKKIFSLLK